MASVMPSYSPAYRPDEIKFNVLRSKFADKRHDLFVVYDDSMDQIIVRFVEPTVFASEYYADDSIAFLVRDSDREVIGFTIVNFQSTFLPKAEKLNELWKKNKLADQFREYTKATYEPKEGSQNETPQMTQQRIVAYSAYQSKAAAELVTA